MSLKEREKNRQVWLSRVKEGGQSNLARGKYCQKHGINSSTFGYWVSNIQKNRYPLLRHSSQFALCSFADRGAFQRNALFTHKVIL